MAYKINGNVVIDDSGQGFFENLPAVLTPTNVDPAEGELFGSPTNITLQATAFSGVYETHFASQWQIANALSFATANIVYDSGNSIPGANTITTDATLEVDGEYYWRVRYISNNNVFSQFSEPTSFTANIGPPDGLGCPYLGGYFTGNVDIGGGVCYYLIVAPNATGCACCVWKTSVTATGGTGACNGYLNTYTYLNNVSHPAGNFTATRTIGGYSDWYLASCDELLTMYSNKDSMPAGEGYGTTCAYWSSTERDDNDAWNRNFSTGLDTSYRRKSYCNEVRAIRRHPIG